MKFRAQQSPSSVAASRASADKEMQFRFNLFLIITSLFIISWIIYLFIVLVLDPFNLDTERRIRYTPSTVILAPTRGYIFDRNSDILVRTAKFYQIDYDRSLLSNYKNKDRQALREDYNNIAEIIANNSTLSKQQVLSRLNSNSSAASIYINDRIRESDIVSLEKELRVHNYHHGFMKRFSFQQRVYTKGNLAARFLGNAIDTAEPGSNSTLSQLEGICGIESVYDKDLKGVYGWQKRLWDARRNPLQIPNLGKQNVQNGNSLILTIDSRIQEIVEMNLQEDMETFRAKNAVGIVMDPKTGEILAVASISAADNQRNPAELRSLQNLATSFMFEPGSTLKPFTSLAALEKKLYKTSDMIDCRRYITEHRRTIRDSHPFDDLSFRDVIVHSSNVGISKVAEKVGSRSLYERLISFGFGNRTGSDLYGESAGLLRKVSDWQGFSLHSISFGQEIAVTPLQLITAYAALANEGKLMRPYVVKEVIDENNRVVRRNTPQRIRTVSNKTALDTLNVMMKDVVEYGTGTATKLPYISIAGKTGTAEKQVAGQSGYTRNKYIPNFVGFFPVEDPQFVILVLYDEPAYYYHYASMSAVVTFRKITEQILALPDYNIVSRMRLQDRSFVTMPNLTGMKLKRAERVLEQNNINYQITGTTVGEDIVIVNQIPKQGVQFEKNQVVIIVAEPEKLVLEERELEARMPSLVGLTIRQAIAEAKKHQVSLEIDGIGVIASQSIPPGRNVEYGVVCKVKAN